jgi:hypothetical protein
MLVILIADATAYLAVVKLPSHAAQSPIDRIRKAGSGEDCNIFYQALLLIHSAFPFRHSKQKKERNQSPADTWDPDWRPTLVKGLDRSAHFLL